MTDSATAALERLPLLEELIISSEQIDDEFLDRLGGLRHLKRLHIPRTKVTDAGIPTLANLFPELEELGLCYTEVTERGLPHLSLFPELRVLYLCGKNFTLDVLTTLPRGQRFGRLVLLDTEIDRHTALRFARQRPQLEVLWGMIVYAEVLK